MKLFQPENRRSLSAFAVALTALGALSVTGCNAIDDYTFPEIIIPGINDGHAIHGNVDSQPGGK
jgi:hypothetical protein